MNLMKKRNAKKNQRKVVRNLIFGMEAALEQHRAEEEQRLRQNLHDLYMALGAGRPDDRQEYWTLANAIKDGDLILSLAEMRAELDRLVALMVPLPPVH
jgi:hypothetical protein